eukprot:jgi/Bigna1/86769/estExt_fgenesh1_pg.C_130210
MEGEQKDYKLLSPGTSSAGGRSSGAETFELVENADVPLVKTEIDVKNAPIRAVTVFKDRAEVIREIEHEMEPGSSHELIVMGLPNSVMTDSIRVNGEGQFTIHEVQYDKKWIVPPKGDKQGKNAELETLTKEQTRLRMAQERIVKERTMVDSYTSTVTSFSASSQKSGGAAAAPFADLKTVMSTLEFYQKQTKVFDSKSQEITEKLGKLAIEIKQCRDEINRIANPKAGGFYRHDVHVIVQASKPNTAEANSDEAKTEASGEQKKAKLFLIYTVGGATWESSYDCRVEGKSESMTFVYYGMVTQTTGEDWENVQLRLSTATPAIGGKPPSIPTQWVSWQQPRRLYHSHPGPPVRPATNSISSVARGRAKRAENYFARVNIQQNFMIQDDGRLDGMEEKRNYNAEAAQVATAAVKQGFATQFLIKRKATILSGRKPHKSCIGIAPLAMKSMFYGVPSLSPKAYFQVRAKNTSAFPFLPSANVRCFFDGNYVCNTEIKEVISPGEYFSTFVGTDDAIKIIYKLERNQERKEGGLLSSKKSVSLHKSLTTIKNNKNVPIRISVALQLPKSTIDQIKVDLIQPSWESMEKHSALPEEGAAAGEGEASWRNTRIRFNPHTNNVVWLVTVGPGEEKQIPYRYEIKYPAEKAISIQ